MSNCEKCSGSCGGCSGCAGTLTLTAEELSVLETLGQVAFLPVARTPAEDAPVCLGEDICRENGSLILQCLEKKNLITIDYDKPLKGFDYGDHHPFYHGSIGLTARGQQVLELLQIQGLSD